MAFTRYRKAIELDPKKADYHNDLGAVLCDDLKEYDKSIECFRKVLELDAKNARGHRNLSVALGGKFLQFREMKNAAGCLAVAAERETLKFTHAAWLYDLACVRALCASAIREDPETSASDAARLAREQADLAMAWLHKAVAVGFRDIKLIEGDRDLDALREREDFKKLIAELELKKK